MPARKDAETLTIPRIGQSVMRRHYVFLIVVGLAALLRLVTMIAYFPAFWYADSFGYLPPALHPYPFVVRPVGYSLLLLWPLRVFHSVAAVAVVQHVFGLLAGTLIYVLLRLRFQFAGWTATLAAAPVLLSAYEIQLEHFMLSDALFMILTVAALVIALWRQVPSILACIAVGLFLAAAAITRTEGLPMAATFALAVLVSYASFPERLARVVALAVSFAFPLLAYASWFEDVHGHFELESTYGGAFLAARVEPFADCSVIHPPANERWLCPSTPVSRRLPPDTYLWGLPRSRPWLSLRRDLHSAPEPARSLRSSLFMPSSTNRWFIARASGACSSRLSSGTAVHIPMVSKRGCSRRASLRLWRSLHEPILAVTSRSISTTAVVIRHGVAAAVGWDTPGLPGLRCSSAASARWHPDHRPHRYMPGVPPSRRSGVPAVDHGNTDACLPAAVSSYEARYVVPTVPFFCVAAALAIREIGDRNQRPDHVTR